MNTLKERFTVAVLLVAASITGSQSVWGADPPGIPDRDYTLWGTVYVDGTPLTDTHASYTVSLWVDGEALSTYPMGSEPLYGNWYVLKVPMSAGERPGSAQWGETAYIYVNGVIITEAHLEPGHEPLVLPGVLGDPGETVRMSVSAQIPPAAITDLSASPGTDMGEVDLTWTATGDNANLGTATGYVVKYSLAPITNQTEFDNATTFLQSWLPKPSGETESHTVTGLANGRIYYFAVEAFDSVPLQAAMSNSPVSTLVGHNVPPSALDLSITPGDPKTGDSLLGSYTYYDAEDDPESDLTEMKWYKDTVHQPAYDDQLVIPSSATTKGEGWYFIVKPHDGYSYGELQASDLVTIGNTAPVASDVFISPSSPLTGDDLVANYDYSDADGDQESGTTIRWYKNGNIQSDYNDLDTLPSSATAKAQQWRFTVRPGDGGDELGSYQTSPTVIVGNTAPVADPGGPYQVMLGGEVSLDGSGSSDADGDSLKSYSWDLGDDSTGSGVNLMHEYAAPGVYIVTLIVSDGALDSKPASTSVYVTNDPNLAPPGPLNMPLGWNLISLCRKPPDGSISIVLISIQTEYDAVLTYDADAREWLRYSPNAPPFLNSLTQMKAGAAYWIRMNQSGSLVVQGSEPATAILLKPGWNHVGYNFQIRRPVEECISGIRELIRSIWTYDPYQGIWLRYVPDGPPELNDMQFMEPGKGYLIHAGEECLLDVGF